MLHTDSRAVAHRLHGAQASGIVTCGLSCSAARGILVHQPGMERASPALRDGFFTAGPPGRSLRNCFGVLLYQDYGISRWETDNSISVDQICPGVLN